MRYIFIVLYLLFSVKGLTYGYYEIKSKNNIIGGIFVWLFIAAGFCIFTMMV